MRIGWLCAALSAAIVTGCSPGTKRNPEKNPLTGAESNVLGQRLSEPAGGFSYLMPAGWSASRVPELAFQLAQEPQYPGYRSNIRVTRETVPLNFAAFLEQSRTTVTSVLERPKILEESDFTTASGLAGKRWKIHAFVGDSEILQIFYLFPATGDDKLVMTASCTVFQETRTIFVFDAAARSLELK